MMSVDLDDKMFKPRIPKTDEVEKKEIKKKFSALKAEIAMLGSSETYENAFSFDDVVEILEKENASLSKLLDYEEAIRTTKLEKEKSILLRDSKEEKRIIAACSAYVSNESFLKGEAVDSAQEVLLKLKLLHIKLKSLLKKFAHNNFPVAEEASAKSSRSRRNVSSSKPKKSILDILKLLLPELSSDIDNLEQQILEIDETMPNEIIEFLLSGDIIEKCPDNPTYIKLLD